MSTTTGPINGTQIGFYIETVLVGHCTDTNFDFSVAAIDTTTKNSGGHTEIIAGKTKWGFSGNGITTYDDATAWTAIFTACTSRTQVTVKYTTGVTGDPVYSGAGYFTKVTETAKMEAASTFTFTFEGTAALTIGTN